MNWTNVEPKVPGWYWVRWRGYEYAEVVLITERLDIFCCGQKDPLASTSNILCWSELPIETPK